MEHMGRLIAPAAPKPRQNIWSIFGISAGVEHVAEPHTMGDVPLTTQDTSTRKKNPWTRTHSHFALMGGFTFEADDSQANFIPYQRTRLTLTPRALRKLAIVEPMLIPDISERTIRDKSKANWLAKSLACLQACWFITQVVGRAATSAPISLLEMNTFLHALCCLIIYLAWWHKPFDIEEPEVIKASTEHTHRIFAWMIMHSIYGASRTRTTRTTERYLVHRWDLYKENTSERAFDRFNLDDIAKSGETSSNDEHQPEVQGGNKNLKVMPGQIVNGFCLIRDKETDSRPTCSVFSPVLVECLRLANLLRTSPDSDGIWKFDWSDIRTRPISADMVVFYASSYAGQDDTLKHFRGSTIPTRIMDAEIFLMMMVLLAGCIYGLVHLMAWNAPFTSLTQRWMWRASCLVIASPLFLCAVVGEFLVVAVVIKVFCDCVLNKDWGHFLFAPFFLLYKLVNKVFPSKSVQRKIAVYSIVVALVLVYLTARVFLIVECFINISQLPPEVYQIPQWSQYIPHLGGG